MNRKEWIASLELAYRNYRGTYLTDKECQENIELLKTDN